MMELIPPGTHIDFIRYRKIAAIVSLIAVAIGGLVLSLRGGPSVGIDFAGGSLVHVRFSQETPISDVRSALQAVGLPSDAIQDVGGESREFLIRVPLEPGEVEELSEKVTTALTERFGGGSFEVLRVEAVGPRVGEALRQTAILAIVAATAMMGIYIWARFEWRFGVGAAAALVHDVAVTMAALLLWNYEFDLTIVAALLTVVGYSVNDTVIVSDRIRENMRKDRRASLTAVVNRSINETLSRTVLTMGTTVLVIGALFVLGGTVIHGFAFTLLVGFIVGTYSSIYVASPVVLAFEKRFPSPGRRP